jgi:signal peptidase I
MAESKTKPKSKAPWRENIEALASAIIVALTFKVFFLEVSQIPSGSMQPTLMGSPAADVKDRVLVDKLTYRARDPERWEVVVFQHPNMRSLTMVKRLVGMPGEQLRVLDGDLWTRPNSEQAWSVLRKPDFVQRSAWRKLDPSPWGVPTAAIALAPDAPLAYAPRNGVLDRLLDGYAEAVQPLIAAEHAQDARGGRIRFPLEGHSPIADLRLCGEFALAASTRALRLEFREGEQYYTFVLPGPAADANEAARIEQRDAKGTLSVLPDAGVAGALTSRRLAADQQVDVIAQNMDDELRLCVDGVDWLRAKIPHQRDLRSQVKLVSNGGAAKIEALELYRDVHYTSERSLTAEFEIPAGHYVMLGDNSPESADGREWQMIEYEVRNADRTWVARGNYRPSENPLPGRGPDGKARTFLIDEWGERVDFPTESARETQRYATPLVPRELIKGRAFAIFWPIRPDRGVTRLGWIR